jgi:hypothetical protein
MPSMGLGLGLVRSGAGGALASNVLVWNGFMITWAEEPLTWS